MAAAVFGRSERADAGTTGTAGTVRADGDRRLVEDARRDPARFDALYRKYLAQVYAYAVYELADRHAAEDATETVFLRALAGLRDFRERAIEADRDGSSFRVWLFRIARNVVSNERRSRRRRPSTSLDAELDAGVDLAAGLDVEREVVARDEATTALNAVRRLPGDRRRAVVLRFVHEMTTPEVAAILGRSEGAVRVLVHRGLRAVARDLRGAGDGAVAEPR